VERCVRRLSAQRFGLMDEPGAGASPPDPDEAASRSIRERGDELRTRADETLRALEAQADVLRRRHASVRIAFEAYDRDRRNAGSLLAGGLAYRLFIWLVPAALVVASTIGLVADLSSTDAEEVARSAGLGASLTATVARAAEETGRASIILLSIGLWALLWSGRSVVKALRLLAGVVWRIRPGRLTHSLRASVAFSGIAFGLIASPILLRPFYAGRFVLDLIVWIATPIVITPLFAWVFAWLPHPDGLRWTTMLPGAALLAIGLQLMRIATSVYFAGRLERVEDLYGAFGLATVFMVWLFLIGRLVVAAMALNAERWRAATAAADA
jgi:uncharacterized BrkB/YihY/UPF0761 family membrane protein